MARNMTKRLLGLILIALVALAIAVPSTTPTGIVEAQGGGDSLFPNGSEGSGAPEAVACVGGLQVDDGSAENAYRASPGGNGVMVERFTLPADPFELTQVCLCWATNASTTVNFEIRVYLPDGPAGAPGTQVAALPMSTSGLGAFPGAFFDYAVGTTITGGAAYIGAAWDAGSNPGVFLCADETGVAASGMMSTNGGATWTGIFPTFASYKAMLIRAEGRSGQNLNVVTQCNGDNLEVNITTGDASFFIDGFGPGLPVGFAPLGVTTLPGPASWTFMTVTENAGNNQVRFLPDITCPQVGGGGGGGAGIGVPNLGLVQINAGQNQPAYDSPAGSVITTAGGSQIILPQDYDGGGADTYVVTDVTVVEGQTWIALWLGSRNFVWVPLAHVTPLTSIPTP